MDRTTDNGLVHLKSPYTVTETLEKLETIVRSKGLQIFACIDHSGGAAAVGLSMPPTKVLIFGDPKSGTPLMLASPTLAIDLPLKALAWEDSNGGVWLSYNTPEYLGQRHGVPESLIKAIRGIGPLCEAAVRGA